MTNAIADRNTPYKEADLIRVPVAAATKVLAGTIACANASGYGVPGATATTLAYLGRYEETVDNTAGGNGDAFVMVRRGKAFPWANSAADAVTQASLGRACYVEDNQTVAKTNGANTRSQAGIVVDIDADGVWVI